MFTRDRKLVSSSAILIQSNPSYHISLIFNLILSSHVRLGHLSVLLPSELPTKSLYSFLFPSIRVTYPTNFIVLDLIAQLIAGEENKQLSYSL